MCYSKEDGEFAARLAHNLREEGIDTGPNDNEILPGENWEKSLRKSLDEASAVVVLFSSNWMRSDWAAFEYGAALATRKKVIPILISNGSGKLPVEFQSTRCIDASLTNEKQLINIIESRLYSH